MKFRVGDQVKILPDAVFAHNNAPVPAGNIGITVYVRDIKNGKCVVGRQMTGPQIGEIAEDYLKSIYENVATIEPYIVQVIEDNFPIYHSASKNSGIVRRADDTSLFFIVDERAGFGKLQMGAGWVELAKVKKLK
jgi:hypothetical protein